MNTRRSFRQLLLGSAIAWVAALAAAAGIAATAALASGDFGPDTCLNGYVWREAVSNDHVCVTADVRKQTRDDNAQAAARRSPIGGAYGPDTCVQGYVWREAVAGDHVCVSPQARGQARNDNLSFAARRNELRQAVRAYRPEQAPCSGSACTTTSDDAARYLVVVDRINVGGARVVLVRTSTGRPIKSWSVSVPANPTAPGGLLVFRTGMLQCSGPKNAYFVVQDGSSQRWSNRQEVTTGCVTF